MDDAGDRVLGSLKRTHAARRMLHCVFERSAKQTPMPFAVMFMRRGDRSWIDNLREPFENCELLEKFDQNMRAPIRGVYVSTDDPSMLSQVIAAAAAVVIICSHGLGEDDGYCSDSKQEFQLIPCFSPSPVK